MGRDHQGGRNQGRMTRDFAPDPPLTGLLDRPKPGLYKPPPALNAQVAQLVEHATENRSVGGSIPPLGTTTLNRIDFVEFFSKKSHRGCRWDNLCSRFLLVRPTAHEHQSEPAAAEAAPPAELRFVGFARPTKLTPANTRPSAATFSRCWESRRSRIRSIITTWRSRTERSMSLNA